MWITKLDIAKGIVKLLKNGKKLPNSDEIAAIVKQFPSGTDSKIIREMQQKKAEESVMAIAEEWLDVLKPPENLQEDGDMITPELWKLTIKETLKVKDYHRVIDLSVVVEGLEAARDIVAKAKARAALEAQKKANAEWRAFEDVFTDAQRYRNRILAHWTAVRTAHGVWKFNFPGIGNDVPYEEREANYRMLMAEGKAQFPEIPQDVLTDNLLLIGMQHVNQRHCDKDCKGYKTCYMQGHRLGLEYDRQDKRLYVTNAATVCPKYVAAKLAEKEKDKKLTGGKA